MILERFRGWSRRRKVLTLGAAAVVAVVVAVVLVWLLVWRGDAPPPPSVLERSEALTTTTAPPSPPPAAAAEPSAAPDPPPPAGEQPAPPPAGEQPAPAPEPAPAADPAEPPTAAPSPAPAEAESPPPGPYAEPEPPPPPPPAAEPPAPAPAESPAGDGAPAGQANLDGVWSVDTTLGSIDDYTSSWAGYRVGEELSGIGATDAVGRTPAVSGTLEIAGATVVAAAVDVDLTTLVSDRPRRDGLVQGALDTGRFPTARFELVQPVTFDALPAAGEAVKETVTGTFTVHGTGRPVEVALEATWIEGVVIVGGTFDIRFEDYGITPPRAPIVLSVEDTATVELLLNFTR